MTEKIRFFLGLYTLKKITSNETSKIIIYSTGATILKYDTSHLKFYSRKVYFKNGKEMFITIDIDSNITTWY